MNKSFSISSIHFSKSKYFFWASTAVLLGGLIYTLLRPSEPVFFSWFRATAFEGWLYAVREKSLYISTSLPQWMVYSLPNGLWAFAYTLIVLSIWRSSSSFAKYFWFSTVPLLIFGFEILQLTGDFPGTFCFQDMISGVIGIIIGFIIVNNN